MYLWLVWWGKTRIQSNYHVSTDVFLILINSKLAGKLSSVLITLVIVHDYLPLNRCIPFLPVNMSVMAGKKNTLYQHASHSLLFIDTYLIPFNTCVFVLVLYVLISRHSIPFKMCFSCLYCMYWLPSQYSFQDVCYLCLCCMLWLPVSMTMKWVWDTFAGFDNWIKLKFEMTAFDFSNSLKDKHILELCKSYELKILELNRTILPSLLFLVSRKKRPLQFFIIWLNKTEILLVQNLACFNVYWYLPRMVFGLQGWRVILFCWYEIWSLKFNFRCADVFILLIIYSLFTVHLTWLLKSENENLRLKSCFLNSIDNCIKILFLIRRAFRESSLFT